MHSKSKISTVARAHVQDPGAKTPHKVAVAKPMPRVAASPKSDFKRTRTDDLDCVPKEQNNLKLAGEIHVKTIESSGGWSGRSCVEARREASNRSEESVMIIDTGRASAGVRLGDSNLLTSIEADPSSEWANTIATICRSQRCALDLLALRWR